ncbi:serine proteinase stubble [Cimex lectularius]|uniref:Peptidase S1 domain-containing protein n=1 Tax=Cimex lectularius TaxID=79782 RepID=A0A8I6TGA7_CIMLE|nr:serine proteinase stubble [Cimex lectularius]
MGWIKSILYCYWFASVLPPPLVSGLSAVYHQTDTQQEGRRFGGYRIVPKSCKAGTIHGKDTGVCMFNYECTKKNGIVVGSCMDGFLFGACCKLPPGSNFISVNVPSSVTQRTSSTTPSMPNQDDKTTLHGVADTVLLHENGTVVEESFRPEDFEFNSKPEMFAATDATPPPPSRHATSPQKSTTWKSTTETWLTTKNQYWSSQTGENFIQIPTLSASGNGQDAESINHILSILEDNSPVPEPQPSESSTTPNLSTWVSVESKPTPSYRPSSTVYPPSSKQPTQNSVYSTTQGHISSMYTKPQPSTQKPYVSTVNSGQYGAQRPSYPTHIPNYSSTSKPHYASTKPQYSSSKPQYTDSKPHYPSSKPHYTDSKPQYLSPKPQYTTSKPQYLSSKPQYTTTKPQYVSLKPQHTTSKPQYVPTKPQHSTSHYTSQNPSTIYYSTERPVTVFVTQEQSVTYEKPLSQHYYTTQNQPTILTQKPQTVYTKKPTTHYSTYQNPGYSEVTKRPTTTTQFVQGPGFQVSITPKPVTTTPEPAPTVIVLGPVSPSKKPVAPLGTIITVNPDGNIVTYKPAAAATAKPIYHGVNHGPLFTTIKPEVYTHGTTGTHLRPVPLYTTPTQVVKDGIPNSTELFAFPPVRDPYVNLTQNQGESEVVSWGTQTTVVQDTTPPLVEDETLDNKVHKFVEKIVQSLQGNFEDLEHVLINGESTQNVTVSSYTPPVKRPTTTTKKPTRKPTKKPTTSYTTKPSTRPKPTPSLITRPPPRPSTSKPQTTKRPIPTTTIFLEETDHYQPFSETTPVYSSTEEIDYRRECGVRPLMKNGRIVGGKGATFGEWPWQVLVREATWLGLFTKNKCGGVLITNKYVITAAHCQPGFLASLIAVFGEYDISGELESKRSVSRNVRRVIVHRHYDPSTFENDISLLELESPVVFDQHIVPICMPQDNEDFTGKMATVTGWGRLKYGGGVPSVLQEVQVPVMENNVCQEMFHTAGHAKNILQSFICAGYANGQRDSCEGDSGGPLMIEKPNGHWVLAGTVSHGIKCAAPYLPGVYMRTTYYKPWLETITGVSTPDF